MTFGKASLLAVCLVGAVGLGVAIGMSVAERTPVSAPGFDAYMSAPPSPTGDDYRATRRNVESRPAMTTAMAASPANTNGAAPSAKAIDVSAPELQKRLKPLLSRGTDMTLAADGFRDAHQFATIAHAAHNTQVPFVLLKHRVLVEGKSVASAIRESKPDLDAAAEAARARNEATAELADIQG
jgi:hypothetical protein